MRKLDRVFLGALSFILLLVPSVMLAKTSVVLSAIVLSFGVLGLFVGVLWEKIVWEKSIKMKTVYKIILALVGFKALLIISAEIGVISAIGAAIALSIGTLILLVGILSDDIVYNKDEKTKILIKIDKGENTVDDTKAKAIFIDEKFLGVLIFIALFIPSVMLGKTSLLLTGIGMGLGTLALFIGFFWKEIEWKKVKA